MVMMARLTRRAASTAAVAALGAGTALLAGCGSGPAAGTGSAGGPGTAGGRSAPAHPTGSVSPAVGAGAGSPGSTVAPTAPGVAACATSALRIALSAPGGAGSGNAAGNSYATVDFFNVSGHPCDLYGYPGVSFASGAGATIGAPARRTRYAPVHVIVAPGGTAHAWIDVIDAQNYPARKCGPVTVHRLRVFPPGERTATYVRLTAGTPACSSAAETTITVDPVRAGTGVPGRMP